MPNTTREIILGIDPGIGRTGFGVIERRGHTLSMLEAGIIRTTVRRVHAERLQELFSDLRDLIRHCHATRAAVEKLFFVQNVTTGMAVSEARGITLLALAEAGLSITEFSPAEVKIGVTGFGRADKRQVREMVKRLLKLKRLPGDDDASDALAVAICAAQTPRGRR
jgi:crossover junction endodeoxyribonuclease RuvC